KVFGIAQAERNPLAPEIPTLGEAAPALKDFDYPTWAGLLVRADTPDDVTASLQQAMAKALADPKVREAIEASGSGVGSPLNLEQSSAKYRDDTSHYQTIVKDKYISVN